MSIGTIRLNGLPAVTGCFGIRFLITGGELTCSGSMYSVVVIGLIVGVVVCMVDNDGKTWNSMNFSELNDSYELEILPQAEQSFVLSRLRLLILQLKE